MVQAINTISPSRAGQIVAIVSIISPIVFMFHPMVEGLPPHFTFYSIFFVFEYLHGITSLQIPVIYSILAFLLISVPRFIYSYQVKKFYSGVSTLRRTIYAGVFAEIGTIAMAFVVDLSVIISVLLGGWMTSLIVPLPIPLFAFLILKKIRSPMDQNLWSHKVTETAEDHDFLKDSA